MATLGRDAPRYPGMPDTIIRRYEVVTGNARSRGQIRLSMRHEIRSWLRSVRSNGRIVQVRGPTEPAI